MRLQMRLQMPSCSSHPMMEGSVSGDRAVCRWRLRAGIAVQESARKEEWNGNPEKIEVECFSLTTSRAFDAVVASLKAGVGNSILPAFANASRSHGTFAELEHVINRNMGKTGLMLFLEFYHGAVIRKETGLEIPKIVRLVIGNPRVMKEMAKHVPDAGSYAPVTVLVDERADGVLCPTTEWSAFWSHTKTRMP